MHSRDDQTRQAADRVAPDCAGMNFYDIDHGLQSGMAAYLSDDLRAVVEPHMRRLGEIAGGRLDELALDADRHPPVLHPRDRTGRDHDVIEYHPANRDMEAMAYGAFSIRLCKFRNRLKLCEKYRCTKRL